MDSDFNLYLLEINTNPGLEESSPLINKIIPRMIDDALRLTIDDVFDTKYIWDEITNFYKTNEPSKKSNCEENKDNKQKVYNSPFPVEGYSDSENVFALVCSLIPEPTESKKREKK